MNDKEPTLEDIIKEVALKLNINEKDLSKIVNICEEIIKD